MACPTIYCKPSAQKHTQQKGRCAAGKVDGSQMHRKAKGDAKERKWRFLSQFWRIPLPEDEYFPGIICFGREEQMSKMSKNNGR